MTDVRITMGRIDYMNVWPIYHGFDTQNPAPSGLTLVSEPPATLNGMLEAGRLDISAISAFAYAENFRKWRILPELGIGCDGRVMSVLLISRYPLHGLSGKRVKLTKESASAANLTRLIFKEYAILADIEAGVVRRPEDLASADAGLVIGDAALSSSWQENPEFPYIYDLATLWKEMTGHPFVFGLWAVRREVSDRHPIAVNAAIRQLYASRETGIAEMETVIGRAVSEGGLTRPVARRYFDTLDYRLPASQVAGLSTYFRMLHTHGLIRQAVPLDFHILSPKENAA